MRIAVTGGNGDLGRTLVPYLLTQGHEVVSLDLSIPAAPAGGRDVRRMVVDTRDFGQVVGALRGCDAAVHLAAHRSPEHQPDPVVYADNTVSSYNVLSAATALGIERVCLASSINAIGGVFSRGPRYDYFPVDEAHPTYAEDPYSLSKWVLEQQADAFARRYPGLRVASLRFHWILPSREQGVASNTAIGDGARRHLWGWTDVRAAARACLLALTADYTGHQACYIVAPTTVAAEPSRELAARHYPDTPIRGELAGNAGFFSCARAERVLGWRHDDPE